jgi:isoleucyl-tRNA synthetase
MRVREVVEPGVKDSMMLQMNELQQWGIMTDWRYSYFTLMPSYQAMVIRKFGQFMQKGMVTRSDRPVFWSVESQKVLAEDEMVRSTEIIDCVIMKLPITRFGKKAQHVQELYPDAKALVFCSEPWRVVGMNAAAINENVVYVLTKWQDEYLIVAEKRLGELQMRTGQKFKKLVTLSGDSLDELVL